MDINILGEAGVLLFHAMEGRDRCYNKKEDEADKVKPDSIYGKFVANMRESNSLNLPPFRHNVH